MLKMTPLPLRLVVTVSLAFAAATAVRGEVMTSQGNSKFVFKDSHGNAQTVPVVSNYYPKKASAPPGCDRQGSKGD